MDHISNTYESPVRVWMGPNLYIFIHDAKCAEQVLKGRLTIEKPKVYEAIKDALGGNGLFSSNGKYILINKNQNYYKIYSLQIKKNYDVVRVR